eukprot:GHVS01088137.1.p1 GENE.GHVS01088137.1~~GHVS01088137.1.p1  ORF type:complete len:525 (+),score=54.33 GHVS01088137.1:138-1712(+)
MQQKGYPVNVGVTAVTLFSLVVGLSQCCCQAAAPLRSLTSGNTEENEKFIRMALKLDDRPNMGKPTYASAPRWKDMDIEQVSDVMKGANFYGFSRRGPVAIARDGAPVAFEVTMRDGDTILENKIGKVLANEYLLQQIATATKRAEDIVSGLHANREAALTVCPRQQTLSFFPQNELSETAKLLREIGDEMANIQSPESADVAKAAQLVVDAYYKQKDVNFGVCLGLPVMAFKIGRNRTDADKFGDSIKKAFNTNGNYADKFFNLLESEWTMVPLDTKEIDVSVDEDGKPSYVVFRAIQPSDGKLNYTYEGVHCTLHSTKNEFSILKLKVKDLQMIDGPPNKYAKYIVAAMDNPIVGMTDLQKTKDLSRYNPDMPDAWKNPLPFFWSSCCLEGTGPSISRDAAQTIVMNSKVSSTREAWMDVYEGVTQIDRYPFVLFQSLIDKNVNIWYADYTVMKPKGEGIFTLVKDPANPDDDITDITITRAYYTTGRHHSCSDRTSLLRPMFFIFNDGGERRSKGFVCRVD